MTGVGTRYGARAVGGHWFETGPVRPALLLFCLQVCEVVCSLLLPPPSSPPSLSGKEASVHARVCVLLHDAQSCWKGHSLYTPIAVIFNADIHAHGAVWVLVCDRIHVAIYKIHVPFSALIL